MGLLPPPLDSTLSVSYYQIKHVDERTHTIWGKSMAHFCDLTEEQGFIERAVECNEELFWMLYLNCAFPFPGWPEISYIQAFHTKIDTSADPINALIPLLSGEKLKIALKKLLERNFISSVNCSGFYPIEWVLHLQKRI